MRVNFRSMTVEVQLDDSEEIITVTLSASFSIIRAVNEYGMPVSLTYPQVSRLINRIRTRLLDN